MHYMQSGGFKAEKRLAWFRGKKEKLDRFGSQLTSFILPVGIDILSGLFFLCYFPSEVNISYAD